MRFPHASQSADANTTYDAGATLNSHEYFGASL